MRTKQEVIHTETILKEEKEMHQRMTTAVRDVFLCLCLFSSSLIAW